MPAPADFTAVYPGPFDPPTAYHRGVVERLAAAYAEVVVVPVWREDGAGDIAPVHRATITDLGFADIPNVRVDLSDLEEGRAIPAAEREKRLAGPRPVTHVVPGPRCRGGEAGRAARESGPEFWAAAHFTVLVEPDEPIDTADLPPRHTLLEVCPGMPSAAVRSMLFEGDGAAGHLGPRVYSYAVRHGLYGPNPAADPCPYRPTEPKFRLFVDERNERSRDLASVLRRFEADRPEMVVAIGGDGTMLRAIRQCWRERLPFYGINTGGLGFLLNGRDLNAFWDGELRLYQLPLLHVVTESPDGSRAETLAFNDTWVERATGQTAWVRVTVNGQVRVPKLVSDGALVATAAGSSSYARAMGATPVPLNADVLILAGSNVLKPAFWKPVVLPADSVVEFETVDPVRRPLQAYIDGVGYGPVRRLTARVSRTAAVELAFSPDHDPVRKLGFVQFPKSDDDS